MQRETKGNVLLHQDNVPIHTVWVAEAESANCGIKLLHIPSYPPESTTPDLFLFPKLKPIWKQSQRCSEGVFREPGWYLCYVCALLDQMHKCPGGTI